MSGTVKTLLQDIAAELLQALDCPTVTEVIINRPGEAPFVLEAGGGRRADFAYSADTMRAIIKLFASAGNSEVRENHGALSLLNTALTLGSGAGPTPLRVAALLPKYSITGPSLCIRRHAPQTFALEDIARVEARTAKAIAGEKEQRWTPAAYLRAAVAARRNILISGSTDSGKTTYANALLECISPSLRLLTIEDAPELKLLRTSRNYVQFLADAAEGMSTTVLLKLALRYRPDVIIVGEVRGGEAYDLVEAWGAGHDGGLSTIHANDAAHALLRLQSLVLDGAPHQLSEMSAKVKISSAVDVIVHLWRSPAGKRRIGEILALDSRLHNGEFSYHPIKLENPS